MPAILGNQSSKKMFGVPFLLLLPSFLIPNLDLTTVSLQPYILLLLLLFLLSCFLPRISTALVGGEPVTTGSILRARQIVSLAREETSQPLVRT